MAVPQYNAIQYDVNQYDASTTFWVQSLSETQGSSDTRIGGEQPVKTESLTGTDALLKLVQQAARTESISESDARIVQDFIARVESMSESDATALHSVISARSDSLTPSDVLTKFFQTSDLEAEVTMDAIMKFAVNGRFETVTMGEPIAQPPVMYNTVLYNTRPYDQNSLVGFAKGVKTPKADAISLADAFMRTVVFIRLFGEALTMADILLILIAPSVLNDSALATDTVSKQITGKVLNLPLKVRDWLDVKRVTYVWN